jgi:hypothetical protein
MTYGHAERNLALIRQLEAETRRLLASPDQQDLEQSSWLQERAAGAADAPEPGWASTDHDDGWLSDG